MQKREALETQADNRSASSGTAFELLSQVISIVEEKQRKIQRLKLNSQSNLIPISSCPQPNQELSSKHDLTSHTAYGEPSCRPSTQFDLLNSKLYPSNV